MEPNWEIVADGWALGVAVDSDDPITLHLEPDKTDITANGYCMAKTTASVSKGSSIRDDSGVKRDTHHID